MAENQEILCEKCGCPDFEYDSSWNEYSCESCGWIVQDEEKISAIQKKIPERNKSASVNDPVFELHVTFSGPKPPSVPKELLEKEYQKWKFITENEPSPIDSKDRWFNPNRKVNKDIKGLPRWMPPILSKTDFEDEEIRNQLLSGPKDLRSLAVAVRKRIRVKRKEKESIREELDFLYRLAVLDDLIKKFVFP